MYQSEIPQPTIEIETVENDVTTKNLEENERSGKESTRSSKHSKTSSAGSKKRRLSAKNKECDELPDLQVNST